MPCMALPKPPVGRDKPASDICTTAMQKGLHSLLRASRANQQGPTFLLGVSWCDLKKIKLI